MVSVGERLWQDASVCCETELYVTSTPETRNAQ